MRMLRLRLAGLPLAFGLLTFVPFAFAQTQEQTAPVSGAPAATTKTTAGPAKGYLVIVGGGTTGSEIWKRFIDLAGGADARIVYVPTAEEDAAIAVDKTPGRIRSLGVKEVAVLHTRDRAEADSEKFVAPLKTATGVWLGGGRQWHLADSYLGTRTQVELNAVLDRGGVIGGSSAGATIQGSFLVRGDTQGNESVVGDHVVGFGFLKNAAIDQHILVRNRQFDLIPLVEAHPELLGIGINESTAIVVHDTTFEVIGASYVAITDAGQWGSNTAVSPNDAGRKGRFYFLAPGQKFDLTTRRLIRARRSGSNATSPAAPPPPAAE